MLSFLLNHLPAFVAGLLAALPLLHFIASKTETKADDTIADALDKLASELTPENLAKLRALLGL